MNEWMIWVQDQPEKVRLYHQTPEGLKSKGELTLDEVFAQTGSAPVTLALPTESISFVEAQLPKTTEKRLRLALPALVEESIASQPEENFYALAVDYQAGAPSVVAVISIQYLKEKIQACLQAGLNLVCVTADCFLLPEPQEKTQKLLDEDRIVVRTGAQQGFALHKHHAVLIMQELEDYPVVEPALQSQYPFNFLQGAFVLKQPRKPLTKKKLVYYALGGCFALHLLILIGLGAVLDHRLKLLKDKSLELYAQAFPGALKVSSPKTLIERELKNSGSGQDDPFVQLMTLTSTALSEAEGLSLQQMDYQQQRLSLQVTLPNLDTVESLTQKLSDKGLEAKQAQVTEQDSMVRVHLLISRGGQS